ncbi:TauD/TfdA family dioxygenase [Halomicronema sp. CCY15110]|uniref:TauD/TfdA family dioxygenase n=1 Tax=Halomicronema sp. CCY15110 TaxID=2767773 RepID=UPI001951035B|nr:TauD/TfdA family dioxygenase [Halomicronema sp. CCY15110]
MPRLHLAQFTGPTGQLSTETTRKLAAELVTALRTPPHWLVLVTDQQPIDLDGVINLLAAVGQPQAIAEGELPRISTTQIRVDTQQAARHGKVTRYSRTPDALPLHTDCSNKALPPNLVAFAMERPDPQGGGESVMLSAADLVHDLPADLLSRLRQPIFPFTAKKRYPILQGEGDEVQIRYYRQQINSALSQQCTLSDEAQAAIDELERYLARSQRSVRFAMQAGEVVIMDNRRVLHGRSAMAANSPRLMHRFRLSVPALSTGEA